MKYSFMSFSCPDMNFQDIAALAKKTGYDGVELRIDAGHAHGAETSAPLSQIKSIKNIAEYFGIDISCIATSCKLSDTEHSESVIDSAKRAAELADLLGCKIIRVFGGFPPENTMLKTAENLTVVSDFVANSDIKICLETHDYWSDPHTCAKLMEMVGRPNIAVNWDIMHPVLAGMADTAEAYELLKPWIYHCHVHDGKRENGNLIFLPIGEGDINHTQALRSLKTNNYSGYLSGEWINWNKENCLTHELLTLKKIEAEI